MGQLDYKQEKMENIKVFQISYSGLIFFGYSIHVIFLLQ